MSNSFTLMYRQADMCKSVLRILILAGRHLEAEMSQETWTVLIKVMLGVTDFLLHESLVPGAPTMSEELCEPLLRVLFELWLRSKTVDTSLWASFQQCFGNWTHRIDVITLWNSVTLALSHRTIRLLYGPAEGSDHVTITHNGVVMNVDLPAEFTYYAWHRFLYILGNPCFLSPTNFTAAIGGLGRMIDVLYNVGGNDPYTHGGQNPVVGFPEGAASPVFCGFGQYNQLCTGPADGNTLLHMFGSWLFEAAAKTVPEYDEGRAESYSILCRIFSYPQRRQPFLPEYLKRFYAALSEGLRLDSLNTSTSSIAAIIINSEDLFSGNVIALKGLRVLIPNYIMAMRRILPTPFPKIHKHKVPIDVLKRGTIRLLAVLMGIINAYPALPAPGLFEMERARVAALESWSWRSSDHPLFSNLAKALYPSGSSFDRPAYFRDLKHHMLDMLLSAVVADANAANVRYILRVLHTFVVLEGRATVGLPGLVVATLKDRFLVAGNASHLPSEVMFACLEVLSGLSHFSDVVKRDSKGTVRELVVSLCKYLDNLLTPWVSMSSSTKHGAMADFSVSSTTPASGFTRTLMNDMAMQTTHTLIISTFECLMQWVLAGAWIASDRQACAVVIGVLSKGLSLSISLGNGGGGSSSFTPLSQTLSRLARTGSSAPSQAMLYSLAGGAGTSSGIYNTVAFNTIASPSHVIYAAGGGEEEGSNGLPHPPPLINSMMAASPVGVLPTGVFAASSTTGSNALGHGSSVSGSVGGIAANYPASDGKLSRKFGKDFSIRVKGDKDKEKFKEVEGALPSQGSVGGSGSPFRSNLGGINTFSGQSARLQGAMALSAVYATADPSSGHLVGPLAGPHSEWIGAGGAHFRMIPSASSTLPFGAKGSASAAIPPDSLIKQAAEMYFAQFLNYLGNYPQPLGGPSLLCSTMWSEQEELEVLNRTLLSVVEAGARLGAHSGFEFSQKKTSDLETSLQSQMELQKYSKHFLIDGRVIIALIEKLDKGQGDQISSSLAIIIRDPTGKYCWHAQLKYVDRQQETVVTAKGASTNLQRKLTARVYAGIRRPSTAPPAGNFGLGSLQEAHGFASASALDGDNPPQTIDEKPTSNEDIKLMNGQQLADTLSDRNSELKDGVGDDENQRLDLLPVARFLPDAIPTIKTLFVDDSASGKKLKIVKMMTEKQFGREKLQNITNTVRSKTRHPPYTLETKVSPPKAVDPLLSYLGFELETERSLRSNAASVPPNAAALRQTDTPACKFRLGRLFMTHCGFFSLENRHRIVPLSFSEPSVGTLAALGSTDPSETADEGTGIPKAPQLPPIVKELDQLDSYPERECIGISVLYATNGTTPLRDMIVGGCIKDARSVPATALRDKVISKEFLDFVRSMGWPVNSSSHRGWKGSYACLLNASGSGNVKESAAITIPYWADGVSEVVFHTPYLMPMNGFVAIGEAIQVGLDQILQPRVSRTTSSDARENSGPKETADGILICPASEDPEQVFKALTWNDLVFIVWVEDDLDGMRGLPKSIYDSYRDGWWPSSLLTTAMNYDIAVPSPGGMDKANAKSPSGETKDSFTDCSSRTATHDGKQTSDTIPSPAEAGASLGSSTGSPPLPPLPPPFDYPCGAGGLVYICIHPLPSAPGLYWIRILVASEPGGIGDDHLVRLESGPYGSPYYFRQTSC
jgi:hypothetical protein